MDSYVQTAGQIVAGLSAVGLDPQLVRTASEAVRIGSTMNKTFRECAKGNFIGAAVGLIGSFFGAGPDAAEIRHHEVMEKLDEIKSLQAKMREEIVKTQEMIVKVSEQIQRIQAELLRHFGIVEDQLKVLETILGATLIWIAA